MNADTQFPQPDGQAPGIKKYTENPEVQVCLEHLKARFTPEHPLVVSDVVDEYGHQYVNLVQKGGGVLGVALIGYTYILEQMGIRFLRLAGTSAGAINTGLMAVIGDRKDAKSERILEYLCALDLFKLVDGHVVARWLIKQLVMDAHYVKRLQSWLFWLIGSVAGMLGLSFAFLGLQKTFPALAPWTPAAFALAGVGLLFWLAAALYLSGLLARFKNAGFGINPGDFFYDWIKERFAENGVRTVSDLNQKARQPIPGVHLREGREETTDGLHGDVTFIASELVTGNKIQFPAMCMLFRREEDIDCDLPPAGFVRASMAIPLFFESYFINRIPHEDHVIRQAWIDLLNEANPPEGARLVDGGLLSNFPINLFFNPQLKTPRLPTFGIDLDDVSKEDKKGAPRSLEPLPEDPFKATDLWGLPTYLGKLLSALRGYYDRDFLIQNRVYQLGIGKIDLSGYGWLNFFMSEKTKMELFVKGAQSATEFLCDFDWEAYKNEQNAMRKMLHS